MQQRREDPVLRSSRKEAIAVGIAWLAAISWTIGYCAAHGYNRNPEGPTYVLGVPDWVFYGVFAPWACCYVFAFVLSYVLMADADLGSARDEQPADAPAAPDGLDPGPGPERAPPSVDSDGGGRA
jgi:hypothetical protein